MLIVMAHSLAYSAIRVSESKIKAFCQKESPKIFSYCVERQKEAIASLNKEPQDKIMRWCEAKYKKDFSMRMHCVDNQRKAKTALNYRPFNEVKDYCKRKWMPDYSMTEYCVDNQTRARQQLKRYSQYDVGICKRKWGRDYAMVLYCVKEKEGVK